MNSKVYVLIPTHNRLPWLKESINSVLAQEGVDLKLRVVDNGSTPDTWDYLCSLTDPRVTSYCQDKNNMEGYRFLLESVPEGQYVAFFGDDDHMLPGGLKAKVDVLDWNPDVDLVFSRVRTMDPDGATHGIADMGNMGPKPINTALNFRRLIAGDYIPLPSSVVRADAFRKFSMWSSMDLFGPAWDWQLWLQAADQGLTGVYLPEATVSLRQHPGQDTEDAVRTGRFIKAHLAIWAYWFHEGFYPSPQEYHAIQFNAAMISATSGQDSLPILKALEKLYATYRP